MKLKKCLFLVTLSTLIFYSCQNDNETIYPDNGTVAVQFKSSISGEARTKASGSFWDPNDKIGVFMKKTSLPLIGNIVGGADNKQYTTSDGEGNFAAVSASEMIFYPTDGSRVDLIAYYPYKDVLSNYIYEVDLTNQESQEKIDLLYSNDAKNLANNTPPISLSFSHQLAKITFNITAGEGISDLTGLTVVISGIETKADFNLGTGTFDINSTTGDITTKMKITGNNAFAEAIVLPTEKTTGRSFKFTLGSGKTFTWNIPDNTIFIKGQKYSYNITLKNSGGSVKPNTGWIETPVIESIPNTIYVKHSWPNNNKVRNYSMLYDTNYKIAYWVAYPLHSYYLGSGRHEKWQYDPKISEEFQPYLHSGWGISGFDRGHQIPNADRNGTTEGSQSTFYYSNMTAQNSSLNQGMWASLEEKVRTWTAQCDTLYVVTGAMITTKTDMTIEYVKDNSQKNIAKPKYFYKALAKRFGNTYYTLAFKMNNVKPSDTNYNNYRLSVSDLEKETGFKFFPGINEANKNQIVESQWR